MSRKQSSIILLQSRRKKLFLSIWEGRGNRAAVGNMVKERSWAEKWKVVQWVERQWQKSKKEEARGRWEKIMRYCIVRRVLKYTKAWEGGGSCWSGVGHTGHHHDLFACVLNLNLNIYIYSFHMHLYNSRKEREDEDDDDDGSVIYILRIYAVLLLNDIHASIIQYYYPIDAWPWLTRHVTLDGTGYW